MKSDRTIFLKVGQKYDFDKLILELADFGYAREESVLHQGDYIFKGGNLSIFPVGFSLNPIRVDFFGSEIETIFEYNVSDGRKITEIDEIKLNQNILVLPGNIKVRPENYVVHDDHGVGLFSHFESKKIENKDEFYIVLKYLNDDLLFVPIDLKEKISSYVGVGRKKPRLNKLGSQTWQRTYKKTYENVLKMAKELLILYAQREVAVRKPLKYYSDWQKEILSTFGFKDTEDQSRTMKEVYSDLSKTVPMDRLICGDVGFGKTEIAIRASAQVCANGYQVAVLVPTTILCEQHYATLTERFKNLPVRIEHLSRLVDSDKQKIIVDGIKNGDVDIVIGTHKLFTAQLKYKNLGLLVIDEEQKFGVKDKEKLKQLKTNLNTLTLTATPIPRTLFMGLSGLRDISQINTPPLGRKEIDTEVKKYSEDEVLYYVNRETERDGQVYYLHNEVRTIGAKQNKLQKMFPNLRVSHAHGQMSETTLAQAMGDFAAHKIDVLVCSTIIENGLDLPNVNTLIVEDADKFGLSQLYQIRGRIGRSSKQSYALFTYRDKKITDNAFKRFKALVENTQLGTGYNIALSDLEIRGGGNILGKEQHGNMEAVGLILYTRLLNKAVENLRKTKSI